MQDIQLFKAPLPPAEEFRVDPTPEALTLRENLIATANLIQTVKTPEENSACSDVGSAIQKQIKSTEQDGLKLRRPYNSRADIIKQAQDDYLAPLRPILARLGRLATVFRVEQEAKAERECQARAAEIVRLQEQARKAAEDAQKKEAAGDLAGALMGELAAQAAAVMTTTAIAAPEPEATKTAGQSFQDRVLGWECTDPIALWNARPELCNGPTPKASAIKACCVPEVPVPGLRLWWEAKTVFKSR